MPQPDLLSLVESSYRQHFETVPARASISFLGVEPMEILRYEQAPSDGYPAATSYLSLGMSRYPMTERSAVSVAPATAPRGELLLTVFEQPDDVWRRLAILAAAPAVESAVYSIGMRVALGEAWCAGSRCTGAVVTNSPLRPIQAAGVAPITVFRLLPATSAELAWARVHGSDALLDRWRSAGTELRDLYREPVLLG